MNPSPKSRLVALLLVLFLGGFGIHRFYVGKVGTGLLMLFLTLSWVGLFISAIWVFLDFLVIATGGFYDKEGRRITEWEPQQRSTTAGLHRYDNGDAELICSTKQPL